MPSQRVALVTSEAFPALHEDDRLLPAALGELGIDSVPVVWSDPGVDWLAFDALVIRSPWDYFVRLAEFRAWLDARIANQVRLCNSAEILSWNFHKRYLEDLAVAGVPVVPTIIVPQGAQPDVAGLARARGWDEVVVKPAISAGAHSTHRFRVDEAGSQGTGIARILEDRDLLIQPFVPEILDAGELSLLFFDGEFSHAVRKRPRAGDYRVQSQHGGTTERLQARAHEIEAARACIAAAPALPVYARVDGVILEERFVLMELEVFEPHMFLAYDPSAAGRFARAIAGRLAGHFDAQPTLAGALVHARPLRPGDYHELYGVAADPLVWEQHPARDRHEEAVFRRLFEESLASGGALLVSDARTGKVIGSSRYFAYRSDAREVEIGWTFLARSHWGGRYNAELKKLMLRHAFGFVDSVVFLVGPHNLRSQRALEKIGAVRETRLHRDGHVIYRMTARRFRALDGVRPPDDVGRP